MSQSTVSFLFLLLCIQFLIRSSRQQRRIACPPGKAQFPNPDDRHSFYKCDAGGNPIRFQCPAKTWFNPTLEVCDWDTASNANGNQQPSNPSGNINGGSAPIGQGGTNAGNNNININANGIGNQQNTNDGGDNYTVTPLPNARCPSNGQLYQNPEDCSTYYRCSQGRLVLDFCARGNYYIPENKRCEANIPYTGCKFVYQTGETRRTG